MIKDISNKRKERRKHNSNLEVSGTQEFFTPKFLCDEMLDKIPEEDWADPTKTFCEPCFGNGQFVLYIIWNRIQHGVDYLTALKTCYGVELMQDNVKETYERIFKLLDLLEIDYDKNEVLRILKKNLVCSDFFEWDFENWCKK